MSKSINDPWITVIGIGEDGLDGLSPALCAVIDAAEVLVGGDRHHEKVPVSNAERLTWKGGFAAAVQEIGKHRGRRVVVLASGDPMNYGAGAMIVREFGADAVVIHPAPGAFSLAAARMGWSIPDCETLTIHGRPLEALGLHLSPGAKLLVLSQGGDSPAAAAELLSAFGYGLSRITVLEHLGGLNEKRFDGMAADWHHGRAADLNVLAIECIAEPGASALSRAPGLPDDVFAHDGQLTKREVRAVTLAALQSLPGQILWDIGAGCGSVAIEWLRLGSNRRAVAVEKSLERCHLIGQNAAALGTHNMVVVNGTFPDVASGLGPAPDAIFVGGGVSAPGLLDVAWDALKPGGIFVANGVTLEAEQALLGFRQRHDGDLTRISVERAGPVGGLTAFRPMMAVTQLAQRKQP